MDVQQIVLLFDFDFLLLSKKKKFSSKNQTKMLIHQLYHNLIIKFWT